MMWKALTRLVVTALLLPLYNMYPVIHSKLAISFPRDNSFPAHVLRTYK